MYLESEGRSHRWMFDDELIRRLHPHPRGDPATVVKVGDANAANADFGVDERVGIHRELRGDQGTDSMPFGDQVDLRMAARSPDDGADDAADLDVLAISRSPDEIGVLRRFRVGQLACAQVPPDATM